MHATLGHRYRGRDADMHTIFCYKFMQVSVISMLLGVLGAKLVEHSLGTDCTWPMCQSSSRSAVLCGVVIEQRYDFFCEYRYLQVTSTSGNLVNTTKEIKLGVETVPVPDSTQ